MPVLDNHKYEMFAQGLAKGQSADEAYQRAGYKPNRGNASTLKSNQSVLNRVAELQGKAAERTLVTVESITAELEAARVLAMDEDTANPSAAVAASMGKAKLHGLLIDQTVSTNTHHVVSPELPTDAEWEAEHAALN